MGQRPKMAVLGAALDRAHWEGRREDLVREAVRVLGSAPGGAPFGPGDATAGAEAELQAAVLGPRQLVDLPLTLEGSRYFANAVRRAAAGDTPRRAVTELERFLEDNAEGVWDNSWVRLRRSVLGSLATEVLDCDLRADKADAESPHRSDLARFEVGADRLRLPLSYVLKLALADAVTPEGGLPPLAREAGRRLLEHFLSDNSSPETTSFHVVPLSAGSGAGAALGREGARRFLLTQLLAAYANEVFGLTDSGQEAVVCFAPHAPVRQKELSRHVSDAFYRELYLSPCLSGWDRGEEKRRYMVLCHEVLSRSQLHAAAKLREAGIVTNNLVVLPSVSNVSLANNGTHVSLGSRQLHGLLSDPSSGFTADHEKVVGDLVIKIAEHFLPLFVGTYSAAPHRLGFADFHAETALGFLPHQLDYTHLRMLWRRWRGKADIRFLGRAVTPFGPTWLDGAVSRVFGLSGDFVPDFRLIDYPVCLLSTAESPALDGRAGNDGRLKRDLAEQGIFDTQMSLYLPYRLREFDRMGFSGFEGRQYSVFERLTEDLPRAAELQLLVTAFAYRLVAQGEVCHGDIPDDPSVESERRQVFFDTAIGIPTFFVRSDTRNRFLSQVLARTRRARPSRRYPGYNRVEVSDYRAALLDLLRSEAPDLVESLGMEETLRDLELRLGDPLGGSVAGTLTRGILGLLGAGRGPDDALQVEAREFNLAAERFYRTQLRRQHLEECLDVLCADLRRLDAAGGEPWNEALRALLGKWEWERLVEAFRHKVATHHFSVQFLRSLLGLVLVAVDRAASEASAAMGGNTTEVRRAGSGTSVR